MVMFGAADLARLNNAEGDHVAHVKDAAKRTRQHEATMMNELHGVISRMDAVKVMRGIERALALARAPLANNGMPSCMLLNVTCSV